MVESASLLTRCPLIGTVGSNPTLSARTKSRLLAVIFVERRGASKLLCSRVGFEDLEYILEKLCFEKIRKVYRSRRERNSHTLRLKQLVRARKYSGQYSITKWWDSKSAGREVDSERIVDEPMSRVLYFL